MTLVKPDYGGMMVDVNEYVKPKLPEATKQIMRMRTFFGSSFYTETSYSIASNFCAEGRWLA